MTTITDMRQHLMDTLTALRDRENPMDVDRARAVAQVASVLVDSAKVEVDYIKATGCTADSTFLAPMNPSPDRAIAADQRNAIQHTATGLVHKLRG